MGCGVAEQDTSCSLLEHLGYQAPAEQNQDGSSCSLFTRSSHGNHEQADHQTLCLKYHTAHTPTLIPEEEKSI